MSSKTRTLAGFITVAFVFCAGESASAQGKGGGGNAGTAAGALYGDLYVIERDGAGVPITRNVTYTVPETGTVTVACVQPLATGCAKLRLWGEMGTQFDPEVYDPCAVYTDDVGLIQEVKFGRESVSRAPATVLDKSYAEALKMINSAAEAAECDNNAVKLDPAGRLTLCLASEIDGTYAWKTIDAPLENLGLYRAVMTNGCFANITEEKVGEEGVRVVVTTALDPTGMYYLTAANLGHLICRPALTPGNLAAALDAEKCTVTPDPVGQGNPDACPWEFTTTPPTTPGQYVDKNDMLRAAVFVAAGADKFSPVTLDEVINVNNYLGVNPWTYTTVRKVKTLTIKYFPFTVNAAPAPGAWFKYARGEDACQLDTTAQLLTADDPTDLTETKFTAKLVSVFSLSDPNHVDLDSIGITVCRNGSPLGGACESATDPYYGGTEVPNINGCGGANWFAQAAEDARKTIWYVHNWRVPELAY